MWSRSCLLCLVIFSSASSASFAAEALPLRGRVVDEDGRPVAGVEIAYFWNANGITRDAFLDFKNNNGPEPEWDGNEGQMEAFGDRPIPVKTNSDGMFTIDLDWTVLKLLALDADRTSGTLINIDPTMPPKFITIQLQPLVRVTGEAHIHGSDKRHETTVTVRVPLNKDFPGLSAECRLVRCSSAVGRFEFHLPPGEYEL